MGRLTNKHAQRYHRSSQLQFGQLERKWTRNWSKFGRREIRANVWNKLASARQRLPVSNDCTRFCLFSTIDVASQHAA